MRRSGVLKTTGLVLMSAGVMAAVAALVVRDQVSRHQRNLFDRQPLKRFAALAYLASLTASVELVQLLRDYVVWEPNGILRRRAAHILARLERALEQQGSPLPTHVAG